MATASERAAVGAEEARLEGRGPGGRAAEAARNVATGRDEPGVGPLNRGEVGPGRLGTGVGPDGVGERGRFGTGVGPDGVGERGRFGTGVGPDGVGERGRFGTGVGPDGVGVGDRGFMDNHHNNGGLMERTEEEVARLRRTSITREGEAYCPNPNLRDLPKEFETRVQVIQRYPEMRTVEKTDFVKEIHHEERTIFVPRTRVIMDEVERIDRVPKVRQVPQTRIEIVHRVVTEEREVTDMVSVVEYIDVPRIEQVPRVITEDVEEVITVPVVREVPVTRMVEVPTGNYCEAPAGEFINPGHFNLLNKHGHHGAPHGTGIGGLLHRSKSSSSSSSDEVVAEPEGTNVPPNLDVQQNPDGTVTSLDSPTTGRKKSLLQRIIHH